jgi:shikimate dehydrogenase
MDAPSPYINLGLIGFPLEHSLSPILHQAALKAAGLQGEYRLYPLPPSPEGLQEIGALCQRIRSGTIKGLNVTIPHKQTVSRFVDRLTPIAEAVGAVNTLYLDKQGFLVGDNTDVPGFMRDISRLTDYAHGKAVVLGAGGSARAVVYGLSHACWDVLVLARRVEQPLCWLKRSSLQVNFSYDFFRPITSPAINRPDTRLPAFGEYHSTGDVSRRG